MKILITGGNSAVAMKLLKAFAAQQVILADYGEVPHFSSSTYQTITLGNKNEDILAHNLLNHCLNEGVDALLPIYRSEVVAVAKAKTLFSEFNIDVLLPDAAVLAQYLQPFKSENWMVLKSGELIFATATIEVQDAKELSGAFYIANNGNDLSLITI